MKILEGPRVGGTGKWVRDAGTKTPIKSQNTRCEFKLRDPSFNLKMRVRNVNQKLKGCKFQLRDVSKECRSGIVM